MLWAWWIISAWAFEFNASDCFYRFDRASHRSPYVIHNERSYLLHASLGEAPGIFIIAKDQIYFFAFPKERSDGRVLILNTPELPKVYLHLDPKEKNRFLVSEEGREDPWAKKLIIAKQTQDLHPQKFSLGEPAIRNLLTQSLELRFDVMIIQLKESLETVRRTEKEIHRAIAMKDSKAKSVYEKGDAFTQAKEHLKLSSWPETKKQIEECRFLWLPLNQTAAIDAVLEELGRLQERYTDD